MRSRSIFFPLIMIGTGVLWLLINLGTMPTANLWALINLFPYLLMALGVGLVLNARWQWAGRLVSSLVVVLAVVAVIFASSLGMDKAPAWAGDWDWGHGPWIGYNIDAGGEVPGSMVIVSETRTVPVFTGIALDYPAEVIVTQGAEQSVTLTGDDNLLPQLELNVSAGVLHIENSEPSRFKRVNPSQLVKLTITVTDLQRVDFSSAGSVSIDGLRTGSLRISLSGAGKVTLTDVEIGRLEVELSGAGSLEASGSGSTLELEISGLGSMDASEMRVESARVGISGLGSATLWVTNSLDAEVSGSGSINYYGSPRVTQEVSGLGSITSLGEK